MSSIFQSLLHPDAAKGKILLLRCEQSEVCHFQDWVPESPYEEKPPLDQEWPHWTVK